MSRRCPVCGCRMYPSTCIVGTVVCDCGVRIDEKLKTYADRLSADLADANKRIAELEGKCKSVAVPSTFQFLNDPADDIYTLEDGEENKESNP